MCSVLKITSVNVIILGGKFCDYLLQQWTNYQWDRLITYVYIQLVWYCMQFDFSHGEALAFLYAPLSPTGCSVDQWLPLLPTAIDKPDRSYIWIWTRNKKIYKCSQNNKMKVHFKWRLWGLFTKRLQKTREF